MYREEPQSAVERPAGDHSGVGQRRLGLREPNSQCTAGLPALTVSGDRPRKAATYDNTHPMGSACALPRRALIRIR